MQDIDTVYRWNFSNDCTTRIC